FTAVLMRGIPIYIPNQHGKDPPVEQAIPIQFKLFYFLFLNVYNITKLL
ncbi:MAG: hypothetical protein ACI8SA_001847, partial [Dokdonia sp.]